jgi:peptidoglycan/xylan/chitin deacetylase (PgdA/CDA1 family)
MMKNLERDFVGYGPTPPDAAWPNDARVAVNFVINYEEGSEYSIGDGDGRSEGALTEVAGARVPVGERDLSAESMYEYGSRAGIWRIARQFTQRGLPATAFACALAIERNPMVAQLVRDNQWDVCCHGLRWIEHYLLDEEVERRMVSEAVASLVRTVGDRPLGWYCRYAPSSRTRRILVEEGGFLYDSDSYADDLPFWVNVDGRAHLVVPYSLVTNDVKILAGNLTSADFFAILRDAFDVLRGEGRTHPKMMSVGIHPRLLGHPARIGGLSRFMDYVQEAEDAWVCRRADIARHWARHCPPEGQRPGLR